MNDNYRSQSLFSLGEIAAINRLELEAGEWEGKEEVATIFVKVQLQLFTWSQLYDHVNGICRIRYLIIPYLNETTRAHQRESKLSSRFHSTSYNYTSSGRPSRKVHWLAQQFEIVHAIKVVLLSETFLNLLFSIFPIYPRNIALFEILQQFSIN